MLVLSEIPPSPSPVRGEVGGGGGVWRILSGECRELRVTKPLMASARILEGWALGAFTVHTVHHRDLSSSSQTRPDQHSQLGSGGPTRSEMSASGLRATLAITRGDIMVW